MNISVSRGGFRNPTYTITTQAEHKNEGMTITQHKEGVVIPSGAIHKRATVIGRVVDVRTCIFFWTNLVNMLTLLFTVVIGGFICYGCYAFHPCPDIAAKYMTLLIVCVVLEIALFLLSFGKGIRIVLEDGKTILIPVQAYLFRQSSKEYSVGEVMSMLQMY